VPALTSAHKTLVERTTPEHFRKATRIHFCSKKRPKLSPNKNVWFLCKPWCYHNSTKNLL